jgi:Tripartite tricarboxylate transporter family receptor
VVVENRAGRGGGNIATEPVVNSPADGYTLLMIGPSRMINATLHEKLNFNFIRDIAPVATITRQPFVMVVSPSVPAKTVPEFIAYAKANPRKINMASAGIGTPDHVAGELFKMMTGVNMQPCRIAAVLPQLPIWSGTGADHVRRYARFDRIYQGRQAARPGGHDRNALGGAAGYPNCGGFFSEGGFNSPVHRNLKVGEGDKNLLR